MWYPPVLANGGGPNMTNDSPYTRRRVVQLSGAAAAVGLAGCSGVSTGGDGAESETADASGDNHDEEEGGHDDGHGDDGHETVGEPTATAEVGVNTADDGEAHFGPHVTRVEAEGTVTWVLESGSHTATAYRPDNGQPRLVPDGTEPWDSGMLSEEGETFEHTFETEGVYHYYCAPHETGGMIGSVIVGEPDAHEQPALDDPPEDKPQAVREKIAELNQMCNEVLTHGHD